MQEKKSNIRTTIISLIIIALALVGYTAIRPLFSATPMVPSSGVVVGFPQDFSTDSARYFADDEIYIVNDGEKIYAVTSLCSHLKCKLDWDSKDTQFECGCHGSEFSKDGKVIKSPAKKPLARYAISFHEDIGLVVDKEVSSDNPEDWEKEGFYFSISREVQ